MESIIVACITGVVTLVEVILSNSKSRAVMEVKLDALHAAGIGCIIDFVPVHFATDAWGLADYDGSALYEYPNDAVGVSEWGSRNFMHSRGET
ncbi:MAG: hypothetical protein IKF78_06000 [Atopobiaceae bacterium]|nr:hypothetical protein [Atopobiaceae bacterium]